MLPKSKLLLIIIKNKIKVINSNLCNHKQKIKVKLPNKIRIAKI